MIDPVVTSIPGNPLLQHAAILSVVLPMVVAPLVLAFRAAGAYLLSLIAVLLSFCFAVSIYIFTFDGSIFSYHLGGWAPPLGIEYRIDSLNGLMMSLVSFMGVAALLFGGPTLKSCLSPSKHAAFYASFLLAFTGLMGVCATGDAFNIFVFLEISSLATYALIAFGAESDRKALPATFNYLVMGTIGATFFVIGVGFLYMATGSLNIADIALKLEPIGDTRLVRVGLAFILVGLGLKTAMFPLHQWLPGAYATAPNMVTIFLAATATKVAFYVFLRFLFIVFDASPSLLETTFTYAVAPLAILGMLIGSARAVAETELKRLFAYSSVAQVGYFLLGASLGTAAGLSAAIWHLINHAFMKSALFMALGLMAWHVGVRSLSDLKGLGRQMPLTMAGMLIAGFSLFGLPLTAGFVSKLALLKALWASGYWPGIAAVAISSVLAFVYLGKIVEAAYFKTSPLGERPVQRIPLMAAAIFWSIVGCNILFGLYARPVEKAANMATAILLQGNKAPTHVNPSGELIIHDHLIDKLEQSAQPSAQDAVLEVPDDGESEQYLDEQQPGQDPAPTESETEEAPE